MDVSNREEIIELYDLYSGLLTDKQRSYFEDYYYMDLSITEIAENYSISRNGVFDQLKRTTKLLEEYESILKLKTKLDKIELLEMNSSDKEKVLNILKE